MAWGVFTQSGFVAVKKICVKKHLADFDMEGAVYTHLIAATSSDRDVG